MKILDAVLRYLDLFSERDRNVARARAGDAGGAPGTMWLIGFYVAALLGVLGKVFLELGQGFQLTSGRVIISLVVTAAIFPAVYKQTLEKSDLPLPVQLFVAFGGGFGYKALIDAGK